MGKVGSSSSSSSLLSTLFSVNQEGGGWRHKHTIRIKMFVCRLGERPTYIVVVCIIYYYFGIGRGGGRPSETSGGERSANCCPNHTAKRNGSNII